jgi:hypothetical protein
MIEIASNGWTVFVVSRVDGIPHRRPLEPGRWLPDGQFEATDLSAEDPDVQTACESAWSAEKVESYKKARPLMAISSPPAVDASEKADAAKAVDQIGDPEIRAALQKVMDLISVLTGTGSLAIPAKTPPV